MVDNSKDDNNDSNQNNSIQSISNTATCCYSEEELEKLKQKVIERSKDFI